MGFQKGNDFGKHTKRGKGKKTIIFESLNKLNEIGITPLQTSKELIENLITSKELTNKERLNLLGILTSLFKYQLLSRSEEIRLDELQKENEVLEIANKELHTKVLTTTELLEKLNNDTTKENTDEK